jgi:hypothetical protein
MNSIPMPEQTSSEETLRMQYSEICKSHSAITDFRAKLLALLPIASGSGIFFLLTKRSEPIDTTYLSVIGLFGFLVTLALFIYELRGIQHCKALNDLASRCEFALDSVFTIIDIREKLIVNSKLKLRNNMELILIILVVLILFGGGGYWYTRRR